MELKPCPFCGEKASITLPHEGGAYLNHNCIFVSGCWFENAERAERFWNTRAERTCKLERRKHERAGYYTLFIYGCPNCGRGYISEDAPGIGEYCTECGSKVVG